MWEGTVYVPTRVKVSKKSYFTLNLNQYRNTHYQILNKAKVAFEMEVSKAISSVPKLKTVHLIYTVHPNTKRKFDVSNVCSVVDKFFCDTLVKFNRLKDDNYEVVKQVTYSIGDMREYPCVEIKITGEKDEDLSE